MRILWAGKWIPRGGMGLRDAKRSVRPVEMGVGGATGVVRSVAMGRWASGSGARAVAMGGRDSRQGVATRGTERRGRRGCVRARGVKSRPMRGCARTLEIGFVEACEPGTSGDTGRREAATFSSVRSAECGVRSAQLFSLKTSWRALCVLRDEPGRRQAVSPFVETKTREFSAL